MSGDGGFFSGSIEVASGDDASGVCPTSKAASAAESIRTPRQQGMQNRQRSRRRRWGLSAAEVYLDDAKILAIVTMRDRSALETTRE